MAGSDMKHWLEAPCELVFEALHLHVWVRCVQLTRPFFNRKESLMQLLKKHRLTTQKFATYSYNRLRHRESSPMKKKVAAKTKFLWNRWQFSEKILCGGLQNVGSTMCNLCTIWQLKSHFVFLSSMISAIKQLHVMRQGVISLLISPHPLVTKHLNYKKVIPRPTVPSWGRKARTSCLYLSVKPFSLPWQIFKGRPLLEDKS